MAVVPVRQEPEGRGSYVENNVVSTIEDKTRNQKKERQAQLTHRTDGLMTAPGGDLRYFPSNCCEQATTHLSTRNLLTSVE
jgi:hypothetical protein